MFCDDFDRETEETSDYSCDEHTQDHENVSGNEDEYHQGHKKKAKEKFNRQFAYRGQGVPTKLIHTGAIAAGLVILEGSCLRVDKPTILVMYSIMC